LDRPEWLTLSAPDEQALNRMKHLLERGHLHTVCESADCPNIGECFANQTCTFMILGNTCTRNCRFCAVTHGRPEQVNPDEPQAVALTASQLGLRHVVVTSVTRDDLADGGAGQFAATIKAVRQVLPETTVEVLIPDFRGQGDALLQVMEAGPEVVNHNVETVPRLYRTVRPQAIYSRSIELLARVHNYGKGLLAKSGLMLGLGETVDEVVQVMEDLREAGCDIVTLGQYLSPSAHHHPVIEFIHPDIFQMLEDTGYKMGFLQVSAGPLVRSSYHAGEVFSTMKGRTRKGGQQCG
jgi:lipoic acid synthetase